MAEALQEQQFQVGVELGGKQFEQVSEVLEVSEVSEVSEVASLWVWVG